MRGRSTKWQQPTFNHPPKHYRGCLDKTRMAGNPQLDYDINGKPVRPEDFMYQIATRNKYGRGVSDHKGSASGVGKSLQRAHDAANFHLETARLKQEGARSADPAVRRHWELQPGLIKHGNELNANIGEIPWPEGVELKKRPPCLPKEEHFAFTTTSNAYGIKAHKAVPEPPGPRLGNKFTDSFNGFKYVDGGLRGGKYEGF